MKAAQLRQSILQAAVQGKLVPQKVHDEPASKLLERIRQEKGRLVKEGKIKKDKPLPPIVEDDIPYDLPEGWVWCRIGEIALLVTSGSRDWAKFYSTTGAKFLRMGNLSKESYHLRLNSLQHVRPPKNAEGNRTKLEANDILVSITGEVGSLGRIPDGFGEAYINQHTALVRFPSDLQNEFFPYAFLSPLCKNQFDEPQRGIKNSFRLTDLIYMLIPLPPLAEQQRIIAKVDELMALCDALEAAEKELDALGSRFAEYLPKSILQAAVQGKLVSQNVHDEPVSELLKRIQQEKARLIKDGTLKKEKLLPPITEDEIPYDLPDGWVWCRLGDVILQNIGGGTPSKQDPDFWNGDIPWASVKDLNCDRLTRTIDTITATGLENSSSNLIPAGNIILCTRMGLGKIAVNDIDVAINQDLRAVFLPKGYVNMDYFIYFYKAQEIIGSGMTVKGISLHELHSLLFPLPPLAEQQRIVAKVDELMALFNELKAAKDITAKQTASKVIPFPQLDEDEPEIGFAARGEMQEISAEAALDIREMFGDDGNA